MPPGKTSRRAKRVQPSKKTERQGIALIASLVSEMGHLWNEPQNDFGTDGYIELVDPETERATSRIVLVQSKATSVEFGDRPIGFTCDEEDLRYWLHGNAPVLLVRSHPASRTAYWVSVKDYFQQHPEQRASRRIIFDRDSDRFDSKAAAPLMALGRPLNDGLHLGTPPVRYVLTSNLLPIEGFPERIYSGPARVGRARDAWRLFEGVRGAWPRAWVLWSRRIYTFLDPSEGAVSRLFSGPVDSFETGDWAWSEDDDVQRRFTWLLRQALSQQTRPALAGNREMMWVQATEQLPLQVTRPPTASTRETSRTLVKRYERDDGTTRYVRHLAMQPRFVRYAEQWYVDITPTYHFTQDGREPTLYAADNLAGIKRIERTADYKRNVDTLACVLRDELDLGGLAPNPEETLLHFGPLERTTLTPSDEEGEAVIGEATASGGDENEADVEEEQ